MGQTATPVFDLELTTHDVQSLNSADALAAFLAKLGYDISARTVQTAGNLGLSEAVARPIKRIELLARNDLLQVYLFELKSVTVAGIRSLAGGFRNLAGRFLFVLTADYGDLDFVLLDREISAAPESCPGTPQVSLNPLRFSVDRRRPTPIPLRVLRRFTGTEPTAFDQFDKLRSAYVIARWFEAYFNNRGLFSDHFLLNRFRPSDGSARVAGRSQAGVPSDSAAPRSAPERSTPRGMPKHWQLLVVDLRDRAGQCIT